jgi:Tfp pilus assembly protein PilN
MPKVNLVPLEERQRAYRRQFYIIPIAGSLVLLGALGGSYYYFNSRLSNAENELSLYKQNNANMSRQIAELQQYEDLKSQKQARLSSVTSVYQGRFRWSRMLDDMSFVVPETISLTKISGRVPGAETAGQRAGTAQEEDLSFEGFTYTMPDVAIFMVRLALIPSLTDVSLSVAEIEEKGGQLPIHFIINASLKQAGENQRPAVAPTTGEAGPSSVTPTTTTPTGTSTNGAATNGNGGVSGEDGPTSNGAENGGSPSPEANPPIIPEESEENTG